MQAIISLAAISALIFAISAQAQETVKPGPEHERLKEKVGVWDAVAVSAGKESKGVHTARMALGNLWLIEEFVGEVDGIKFEGHGLTTFDVKKKKYVNYWVDSMMTDVLVTEGTFKDDRLILKGKMPMPDGTGLDCTLTNIHKDANTMVFTLEGAAGLEGKMMEFVKITYKRRAK